MDLSAIDAARRFVALFVFVLNLKRECMNMAYPDLIRAQLDQAISTALHDSTFAPAPLSRKGKVTTGDIVKTLIFMEGGSLHKELREARWSYSSPYPMTLRVVRVLLDTGEYETLATSLPPSFTAAQIKELYHARWGIETAFRELKYNYGLVNLHGRSEEFVRQEIYASLIMASVCARIINEVVVRQSEGTKYQYAVNQKMAVYLCKKFFRTPGADGEQLMRDIARYTEPVRPGRADQRNLHVKGFPGFVYRVAA